MLSRTLPSMLSRMLPVAHDSTLPACMTVQLWVGSQDTLKHTVKHTLRYTPNCIWWHTPSLLDYSIPTTSSRYSHFHSEYTTMYTSESVSSTLPNAVDGTLAAYLALHSPVHSQEWRHFQSHMTIAPTYTPACSFQRLAALLPRGGGRLVVYGRQRGAGGM